MGMYTGLRFKGTVKEEFRDGFEDIALEGSWEDSADCVFREFGKDPNADLIPWGALSYMPDSWETSFIDGTPTDGFETTYDKNSGRWTFQCSMKQYHIIEEFLKIAPYFIEEVEHAEVYYEEWRYSQRYELIDGKMLMTNDKFIEYNEFGE